MGSWRRKGLNTKSEDCFFSSRIRHTRYWRDWSSDVCSSDLEVLVFEDIKPANLSKRAKPKQDAETGPYLPNGASAKSGLNKSIQDAGWSQFITMCEYKAGYAGVSVVRVDPKYTSQVCSGCGTVRKKELSERWHSCDCGTELDRDHNAALNILRLGSSQQGAISVEAPCL